MRSNHNYLESIADVRYNRLLPSDFYRCFGMRNALTRNKTFYYQWPTAFDMVRLSLTVWQGG